MRLSLDGRSLGGSTRVFLDGHELDLGGVVAGNPQWWNGAPLFQWGMPEIPEGVHWQLGTPSASGYWPTPVDDQGQSHLFASAGTDFWARMLGTQYKDSRGLVRDDWAVVAVDDSSPRAAVVVNGALAVWNGTNLMMVEPTGADTWEVGDIHFSRGVLGYRKGGQLVTWPRLNPVLIPGAGVRFDGDYVLAWQPERGLVLHTWTSPMGIVLAGGDNFNPDIRDLGNGHVLVVAGINGGDEGEHRYDIDWPARTVNGQPRELIDLSVVAAPPIFVPTPVDPPPPDKPIDPPVDPIRPPVKPKETLMIAYGSPLGVKGGFEGLRKATEEPHPDGPPYVIVRKTNQKVLSVHDDGSVDERDAANGVDERFQVSKATNALLTTFDHEKVFALPRFEGK